MSASSQSAEADTDNEESEDNDEFTYYPQVTQHPTTIIEGEIVDIVTGADIDSNKEDTGSSFGVVFEDPEIVGGTLWQNRNIPDGFDTTSEYNDTIRMAQAGDDTDYVRGQEVTDDAIETAQERLEDAGVNYEDEDYDALSVSGTDYKVADPTDKEAEVQEVDSTTLGIDVGGGVFSSEEADGFDTDRIMVWYGGISGQRAGRILDFNGLPFTRHTEDGYLVKGLFQAPLGWRNTNGGMSDKEQYGVTKTRDELKEEGTYPRVARPPVLRDDIDGRVFFGIGRFLGGNGFEPTIGRAADDYDAVMETLSNNDDVPWEKEYETDILDMKYDQSPEETLAAAFEDASEIYSLYHGAGWQDEPDNAQAILGDEGADTDGGSFDVEMDDDDAIDHPTDEETTFAKTVAEKLAGSDATPDDAFESKGGLEGLVEENADAFEHETDIEAIRADVYAHTDHLNEDDL